MSRGFSVQQEGCAWMEMTRWPLKGSVRILLECNILLGISLDALPRHLSEPLNL